MIVLYIFLGLLALLLLLIWTPVCYRVNGTIGKDADARVDISWLLRLIRFTYVYKAGSGHLDFYVAFFKLSDRKSKKKKEAETAVPPDTVKPADAEASLAPDETEASGESILQASPEEAAAKAGTAGKSADSSKAKQKQKAKRKKKEKSSTEKDASGLNFIQIAKVLLTYPDRKIIMTIFFRFLKKVFKVLKPKAFHAEGTLGLNDPCSTGLLLGAYEAAAGLWGFKKRVQISGDYNQSVICLKINVAGRISAGSVLWPLIWLCTRKPIYSIIIQYMRSNQRKDVPDGKRKRKQ